MTIIRNNISFELTSNELEAAYREQEHNYRLNDARNHLSEILEGCDNHHLIVSDNLLECIVKRYEDEFDCNVPENVAWENAVKDILDQSSDF